MEFLFGVFLPYTAWSVFVSGTILRIFGWLKTPVPFHATIFPAPSGTIDRIVTIASDFLLFRTLFREDKALWLRVWLFHLSLAMIIAGHVIGIFFLRDQFVFVGLSPEASHFFSKLLGGISGIAMVLSLGALIIGRIANPLVRKLSAPEDFFTLLLLVAITVSGLLLYLPGFHVNLPAVRSYMGGLFHFRAQPLPHSSIFIIHFLLVNLLLLFFPFSRLLHSAGYFVNRAMITEAPPNYPTEVGRIPRSPFATRKAHIDSFLSCKGEAIREARHP